MKLISDDVVLGENVTIYPFVNIYGCTIGDETKIGTFVEIQKGAKIGKKCKISSHTFICEGVTIADETFIGHGVMFINDHFPYATTKSGETVIRTSKDYLKTYVGSRVIIGSNVTILGGISIGEGSVIGGGSVVTKNVPPFEIWAGNPAKKIRDVEDE